MRHGESTDEPSQCDEQFVFLAGLQARSGEEIGADHLQAIAPLFARSEHQRGGLKRLLEDHKLALVDFEIEDLPRLRLFASEVLFDLVLEYFFGQSLAFH